MQSIEIRGLDATAKMLETLPQAIREARAAFFEETGPLLLGEVRSRIGGSGRVQGVQEYYVGSGKGYVAVRAMAKTVLDGYAAGYVSNALEHGHRKVVRGRELPGRVAGKYMYHETELSAAAREAEKGVREIDRAIKAHFEEAGA